MRRPRTPRIFRQGCRGSRYTFGYPTCPNLEDQAKLFALLEPGRIGVELSEEFRLFPEFVATLSGAQRGQPPGALGSRRRGPPARAGTLQKGTNQILRQTRESVPTHHMSSTYQGDLVLGCNRFGKDLEFQLDPGQSTSAIIVHHPEVKYFNIS